MIPLIDSQGNLEGWFGESTMMDFILSPESYRGILGIPTYEMSDPSFRYVAPSL